MNETEFQTKVLESVEATKTKQEQILSDVGNLSKEGKTLLEDITKLKKTANDQQANFDGFLKKLSDFEKQMRREVKMAFGDPIERISRDEAMRTRFNIAARLAVDLKGDMVKLCEPLVKALGEDTSPGSTIIDDALSTEIYDTLSTFGIWSTLAVQRMGTKQTKFPVRTARPVANFILTEAGTISDDSNSAGTSVTLEVELIAALLNVSRQLIEDAEIDITRDVMTQFAEAYANRLDVMAFTADGTADALNGGQTGVFQAGTVVSATAGEPTVELCDLAEFQTMLLTVDPIVLNRASKWWMHPHVLVRMLSITDLNGRPIFQTALEAPLGAVGSILGYPVILGLALPNANVATTRVVAFGDPNGQVIGIRSDYVFEGSDHHKWNTYERSFRGTGRAGTKNRRALAFSVLRLTA